MGSLIIWACQSLFALSHPTGGTVAGATVLKVSDDTDPEPILIATLNGEPFTSGTVVSGVNEYELVVTTIDASDNETEVAVNFEIVAE